MRLMQAIALLAGLALSSVAWAATPQPATPPAKPAAAPAPAATPAAPNASAGATPQTFSSEASAIAFCHQGNVVWYNPDSKIYFPQGNRYYQNTKQGGLTCKAFADKAGYRASRN